MPYQINWLPHGVVWTYTGKVTSAELLQSNQDIYGSERFDALRYQIADFTDTDEFDATLLDIRKIAYLDKAASQSNPRIKVAIVIADETNPYILEYLKHAENGIWETKSFQSLANAQKWLVQEVDVLNEESDFC